MNTETFNLPDLGEGLTEAVLLRWVVAVGDTVGIDQVIAEVETEKSVVELPSPYAGVVIALHGEEGEPILTGSPVIEVGSDLAGTDSGGTSEHEAYRLEERAGSGNVLIGYGTGAGPTKGRRRRKGDSRPVANSATPAPREETQEPAVAQPPAGPVAVRSPIVRRLARDLGVDLRAVEPSGDDGAVTRADVLRAAKHASPDAYPTSSEAASTASGGEALRVRAAQPLGVLRTERFSPLRKTVSAKLSQSRREIPEATVWVDVDLTDLWDLRPQMAQPGERPPSLTSIFARYCLLALEQFPLLASQLNEAGDELTVFEGTSLGIAVNTDRGLMVPVIHRADQLNISDLDGELRELGRIAREGRTPPAQLKNSTFTLNNYGAFGVDGSAAIINYPEVALLGIGRVLQRPWCVDGEIVARRIVQLSLVFDHRVCDGGYAAGFLRAVVDLLENPLRAYPRL